MIRFLCALVALSLLSGCYETGYQKQKREDLERRVKALEQQR